MVEVAAGAARLFPNPSRNVTDRFEGKNLCEL